MNDENNEHVNSQRLSDRILHALNLSLEQKDVAVSEFLARALEVSMTRYVGGADFVERRNYPKNVETAFNRLDELKQNLD